MSGKTETAAELAAAASMAGKATLGGGAVMVVGGLAVNEWAMVVGACVGVLGLILQWHYRRKEYGLREREADARIARLSRPRVEPDTDFGED